MAQSLDHDRESVAAELGRLLDAFSRAGGAGHAVVIELGEARASVHADCAMRLGPPFSEWRERSSWTIALDRLPAAPRRRRAPLLLELRSVGVRRFVDLFAAHRLALCGGQEARRALVCRLAAAACGHDAVMLRELRDDEGAPRVATPNGGPTIEPVTLDGLPGVLASSERLVVLATECEARTVSRLTELTADRPEVAIVAGPELTSARVAVLAGTTTETPYLAPLLEESEDRDESHGVVEVLLLGRVEIRGVDASLARRPKLAELVAWFAAHPHGAAGRIWSAALWPDREVPSQTVANRLSEARRMLGFASDALPRLRRDGERHLLVDVATDWERFRRLSAPDQPAESWRCALELVRGRPFEDLVEGQWAIFEGLVAEIEGRVAATALRLGEVALERGDADLAAWGAQQALRAAPYDERLHRLLMHAADRAGNRAALDGVLSHLALLLEIDGDPLRAVHPETAALYSRLSGPSRARS